MPWVEAPRPQAYTILAVVLVYLFFFWCNSTYRAIDDVGDPDGMNFVDIARNIVAGRGIVQSTGGFTDPHFLSNADDLPSPLTAQPPLYPLLLALMAWLRVPYVHAGLVISVASYGLVIWISYRLVRVLYGRAEALLTVALVCSLGPLRTWAGMPMSESLGLVFALLALHLLVVIRDSKHQLRLAGLAGAVAGLAFATRYALLPLAAFAVLFLALETRRRVASVIVLLVGFGVPVGLVTVRNLLITSSMSGARNPSTVGFKYNLLAAWNVLVKDYVIGWYQGSWSLAAITVVATAALVLLIRRRPHETTRELVLKRGRYVLVGWCLIYAGYIVVARSLVHFDQLNSRLMLPAGIIVPLLLAVLLVRTTQARVGLVWCATIVVLLVVTAREVRAFALAPSPTWEAQIARRPALTWIANETSEDDLIIGPGAIGVPFFLGRSHAVDLYPYPYSDYVDEGMLLGYAAKYSEKYRHIYLVLPQSYSDEASWEAAYGAFIAALIQNHRHPPRGFTLHRELVDAYVFEIRKPDAVQGAEP